MVGIPDHKILLRFIETIYKAGENPVYWQECADMASGLFGHGGAFVWELNEKTGTGFRLIADTNVPALPEYFEAQLELEDPQTVWALKNPKARIYHNGLMPAEALGPEVEFNRWKWSHMPNASPFGFTGSTPSGLRWAFSLFPWGSHVSHRDDPPVDFLTLMEPHVTAAFRLNRRLGVANAAWEVLDELRTGIVLFDFRGMVLAANMAAERMARAEDGLTLSVSGLKCLDPVSQRRLADALDTALAVTRGIGVKAPPPVRIDRPSGRKPYAAAFSPIIEGLDDFSPGGVAVRAIIADLDAEEALDPAALATLFGLTEAEAHVAAQFAENASIDRTAAALNVSRETVRTHMKALFAKFGVKGQAELMRTLSILSDTERAEHGAPGGD